MVNIQRKKTKKESLFLLIFKNEERIKRIYEIKTLQNLIIQIRLMRSSKLIIRCQKYGNNKIGNQCVENAPKPNVQVYMIS